MNILIAGASSGIGRYLSERLLDARHDVWGFARSIENAVSHPRFHASICDVADWEKVHQLADDIAARSAPLEAIIVCAAVQGPVGPTLTVDPESWSAAIRVNLDGTFNVLRAFVPLLRPRGKARAKVICFSGGGATKARANFSAYAAAKTGVVRLVETLAAEWQETPIDINSIAPGTLPTRMTDEILSQGTEAAGESEITMARGALSTGHENFERLGGLIDLLLSPESDGISGKLISAAWDPWPSLQVHRRELDSSDIYTLRRILPEDRAKKW